MRFYVNYSIIKVYQSLDTCCQSNQSYITEVKTMARITSVSISMRQARTFKGIKKGSKKLGFYFGVDPIPEELKPGVTVLEDGKFIRVECIESGYILIPAGKFVAYEPNDRCEHGYNCWEKSNASTTIVKGEDGYEALPEQVEVCITSNGALPWFLTDEMAPEIRLLGNEMEIKNANGTWQRGTIGNSFFVYYNREVDGVHDVALVDADTESAKAYHAMVNNVGTIIYIPLLQFLGSVA